ncbi:glycosyl transferase [Geobacter sulfurreducens]|nr:glycosyl transferase [Geobacter sulfurreducens]
MMFLSTVLLSVLITIALTPVFSTVAIRYRLVDVPNERKVHQHPIPRIGGLAMAFGAFAPILLWQWSDPFVRAYLAGAAILVAFGFIDDFRDLSPKAKFAAQIAAALIVIQFGGVEIRTLGALAPDGFMLPSWVSMPLTLVAIVGVTNAINLADGLDGLAGGICLLIFACIGFLAYLSEQSTAGFIALALSGVIFGFLRFNTHPASIFMGDAGSQFLGFSAVTLSLSLTQGETPLSPLLPLLLVGFPVLDTLTVMTMRISRGISPFAADKNHFHHNLMRLGLTHAEAVLAIYVCQTVLVIAAVMFRYHSDWLLLGGYLAFSAAVIIGFSLAPREEFHPRRLEFLDFKARSLFRLWRREGTVIRATFRFFEFGIPLLLALTCLLSREKPAYVPIYGAATVLAVIVTRFVAPAGLGLVLRLALYLTIPVAVYFSDGYLAAHIHELPVKLYNASFGVLAVCIIVISKFSRRKSGFRSTPLDFLIIILAVVVPNLPDQKIQEYQMGLVAAKIIMLYFSFEVLMAELRGKYGRLALVSSASLALLAIP